MTRVLAVLAAVAMVLAALWVRDRIDDGEAGAPSRVPVPVATGAAR